MTPLGSIGPLGPKDPEEIKVLRFPFEDELEAGETISLVALTCTVLRGADPLAGTIPLGAPVVSGTDVLQRVQLGVDGAQYLVRCKATGNGGNVHVLWGLLDVKTAGP